MSSSSGNNPLLLLSYATIIGLWVGAQLIDIPYVINLMLLVTAILYAACHFSLTLREEQALARGEKPPKEEGEGDSGDDDGDDDKGDDNEEEGEEDDRPQYETLKTSDAMQFPLLGSASLFGLYCAFKYFDKDTVNLIISVYFCLVGLAALTATFGPALETVLPKFFSIGYSKHIEIPHFLPEFIGGSSPWKIGVDNCTMADLIAFLGSAVFSVVYFQTKHWTMNNVMGICFFLQGIERFSLGTYKIGAVSESVIVG